MHEGKAGKDEALDLSDFGSLPQGATLRIAAGSLLGGALNDSKVDDGFNRAEQV